MINLDTITSTYGQGTAPGVLLDHVATAVNGGARLNITERWGWLSAGTGPARRVVCGELVEWFDEDGLRDGRCGHPVTVVDGALGTGCPAHDLGPEHSQECPHGLTLALCAGPGHYPMD